MLCVVGLSLKMAKLEPASNTKHVATGWSHERHKPHQKMFPSGLKLIITNHFCLSLKTNQLKLLTKG